MDLQTSLDKNSDASAGVSTPVVLATGLYLDYNATTPLDPEIYKLMEPYFKEFFGNPASASHKWGWTAENAVQKARMQVANFIGSKSTEVSFTSGATEANNWVIFGLISKLRELNPNEPIHMITSNVEHSSIMKAMAAANKLYNVDVDFLPVNSYGVVAVEQVARAIKPHTKLISLIWVNNEIGSINPIPEIANLAKAKQILLHTDGTQAVGKIPVHATDMGIDFLSFSAHKLYGPKGVGALYIRGANPKVEINPLIWGGGQERGLRSGTLNVPAIVGMGAACDICQKNMAAETAHLANLRDHLWSELKAAFADAVTLNGHPTDRSPMSLNITLRSYPNEMLLPRCQKLGISTGSACASSAAHASHVLRAIGLTNEQAACSMRLSIGRWTTQTELDQAVSLLKQAAEDINL
jgi:cysteine desulfurase